MKDRYQIDGHKLVYHVDRVHEWLQGRDVYPIYAEISLAGACNHRCMFCAFDFTGYVPVMAPLPPLKNFIREAAGLGLKSILFAGEGEPLLHPQAAEIVAWARECGVDAALVSNGALFDEAAIRAMMPHLTWVKISIDAGTPETHARVHGTRPEDFGTILDNLALAARLRRENGWRCTLGAQSLLLPENCEEIPELARRLREAGADYLVVKPYSQHPSSLNRRQSIPVLDRFARVEPELEGMNTDRFQVIIRHRAIINVHSNKLYEACLGLPFAIHVNAEGDLFPCNVFAGKADYIYGNYTREGFKAIWEGEGRKRVTEKIRTEWDLSLCRNSCRLEQINRYLWQLKHPGPHVNFI